MNQIQYTLFILSQKAKVFNDLSDGTVMPVGAAGGGEQCDNVGKGPLLLAEALFLYDKESDKDWIGKKNYLRLFRRSRVSSLRCHISSSLW